MPMAQIILKAIPAIRCCFDEEETHGSIVGILMDRDNRFIRGEEWSEDGTGDAGEPSPLGCGSGGSSKPSIRLSRSFPIWNMSWGAPCQRFPQQKKPT